uniref:Cation-transporting P-type ATPase N-terminal domain-containing protein n=1 Tax=Acrobeloides nanus TaxID=290746 RepID=A0A914EHQ3_9BILA
MANFIKNIFSRASKRKRHAGGDQQKAESLSNSYCEHTWDLDRVRDSYPSSKINIRNPGHSQGLSSSEAKQLLEKNGPNALPKAKEITDLELLGRQFLNFLWGLLLLAAVFSFISFIRQEKTDQSDLWVAIIIIITINGFCFISFYQERKAIKAVSGFKNLLPEASVTVRDGTEASIPAADLVVGDIIRIKNGSRVPADARILQCSQLKLETSAITGEAEPIDHTSDPAPENVNIFDAKNVAFNGSLCVDGDGVGIVIRTGYWPNCWIDYKPRRKT